MTPPKNYSVMLGREHTSCTHRCARVQQHMETSNMEVVGFIALTKAWPIAVGRTLLRPRRLLRFQAQSRAFPATHICASCRCKDSGDHKSVGKPATASATKPPITARGCASHGVCCRGSCNSHRRSAAAAAFMEFGRKSPTTRYSYTLFITPPPDWSVVAKYFATTAPHIITPPKYSPRGDCLSNP